MNKVEFDFTAEDWQSELRAACAKLTGDTSLLDCCGTGRALNQANRGETLMNTVPNLDAMPLFELQAFWVKYHRGTRKLAAELIGDKRPGYTTLANKLAAYALNKACAMQLRLEGKISQAVTYEEGCDIIYSQIPDDLRW